MGNGWSDLAERTPVAGFRLRRIKPWGMAVHTTGMGVVERAQKEKRPTWEVALDYYHTGWITHYLICHAGFIMQLMPDHYRGAHIGVNAAERKLYLSGQWEKDWKGSVGYARWKARWPNHKSPQHLYPTSSPNACYIGVEMIPLPEARENGLWFTDDQHEAVIHLWKDRADEHVWPTEPERLLGHEDVDAYGRWQPTGGWDPGALRNKPRFDWDHVRASLQ